MALLDRFRAQSGQKHPDPLMRLAFVAEVPIDERDLLASIAREDPDPRVRRAAVAKLIDPAALADVSRADADESVRGQANVMLRDIALEAFEGSGEAEALAAADATTDVKLLGQIAKGAARETVALKALSRLTDARAIGSIARHAALEPVRRAALDRVDDHGELIDVALNGEFKDTAVAAVERLSERAELEQVAARSKNKAAAKRARGMLREMAEREAAASAPPPPDPAAEADAAREGILLTLQQLTQADPRSAEAGLHEAEEAWASVDAHGPAAGVEVANRFAAATDDVNRRLTEWRAQEADRMRAAVVARRQEEEEAAARSEEARAAAAEASRREVEQRRARITELLNEAEASAADEDLRRARRRFGIVEREWKGLTAQTETDGDAAMRFANAQERLRVRDEEARQADARARQDALKKMLQLVHRTEALGAVQDLSLKAADRALRDVRSALGAVPPLPSRREYDEVVGRLKAVQAVLAPRLDELRDMHEWQRWANIGIQEQLCEKMEGLKALDKPEEIVSRVRTLQQQWREAADVPRAQGDRLWRRFKAAHDEVWSKCEAHFAVQAEERAANLSRKLALCARAEALAESTSWIQAAEEIKQLQAEWKTIGLVTRGQEKVTWDRFRSACDRFFTRRQKDLVERKAVWNANLAKKEALCVQAEALAESTDWDAAALEIKRLQAEWKSIGPVKKTRSEAIWQRFRGACDRFFARYAQRHDVARTERVAAREAICAELESLARPSSDEPSADDAANAPTDVVARVRTLRSRWQQEIAARGVDREKAVELDRRFAAAFERVVSSWPAAFRGTDLDPDANGKRMEAIVRRMEDLVASLAGPASASGDGLSPTSRLAAMLKEALAANTIGGKVDEESRWRAAQEDVRQAQSSWSRIGPVPDGLRRSLADRFERACRRITNRAAGSVAQRAAGPAKAGPAH